MLHPSRTHTTQPYLLIHIESAIAVVAGQSVITQKSVGVSTLWKHSLQWQWLLDREMVQFLEMSLLLLLIAYMEPHTSVLCKTHRQ